jgi:hypothetical protein
MPWVWAGVSVLGIAYAITGLVRLVARLARGDWPDVPPGEDLDPYRFGTGWGKPGPRR